MNEEIILLICPEWRSNPVMSCYKRHYVSEWKAHVPSPFWPTPALFDTAVRSVISFFRDRA